MSRPGGPSLHALTADEAAVLELRLRALQALDRHYARAATSGRTMRSALRRLAKTYSHGEHDERTFPWELLIDETLTQDVINKVSASYSRSTTSRDAAALRYLLKCLRQVGAITNDEARSARDFEGAGRRDHGRPLCGRLIENHELLLLVEQAAASVNRVLASRDVALICVAASTGARRAELSALRLGDIDWKSGTVFIAHGKGDRSRHAWLHPTAAAALHSWLSIRGTAPGYIFNPVDRFERINSKRPLSAHQIWKVLRNLSQAQGIEPVRPHDMRRFVVSTLLDTHDITLVSKVVGHAQISTTAKYDRRPASRARAAVEALPLPSVDDVERALAAAVSARDSLGDSSPEPEGLGPDPTPEPATSCDQPLTAGRVPSSHARRRISRRGQRVDQASQYRMPAPALPEDRPAPSLL